VLTEVLCANRQTLGCKSTDFEVDTTVQTEMVQSAPAVTRVLESAKRAEESCP